MLGILEIDGFAECWVLGCEDGWSEDIELGIADGWLLGNEDG